METKRPVAYICHTSEDKGAFVIPFAKKLSEKGIKVSVDPWELSHGESLIEKIFTEGIKSADAFIVVLSEFSVRKTWITEEMRPGLVKRITAHSKLIPVVVDDCEIPESLRDIPMVTIRDVDNADGEIKHIVESLYGGEVPTTPEMLPQAAEETVRMIPGLTKEEMQVLKTSCEYSVEKDRRFINTSDVTPELTAKGVDLNRLNKYLLNLDEQGYIKAGRVLGSPNIEFFNTTAQGYEAYAQAYLDDFDGLVVKTLTAVEEERLVTNDDLSSSFNLPMAVVNYIIDIWVARNYVKLGKSSGGAILIKEVTPVGHRVIQEAKTD